MNALKDTILAALVVFAASLAVWVTWNLFWFIWDLPARVRGWRSQGARERYVPRHEKPGEREIVTDDNGEDIGDLFDDGFNLEELDFAELLIEARLYFAIGTEGSFGRRMHHFLDRLDDDLFVDAFFF